jgi:hypothetical protein
MNIKEIFDKATSENKSLTYDEFEKLAKEAKAKFTDLSEGKYVDRQKYEDDLATKDTQITSLNETISTRDTDLASLKEQLENAGSDAGKLEELTANLASLQSKYDADTQALSSKLSAQAYEFAVRDFANGQKFSSNAAKRDFISSMLNKNLPMENGSIIGAQDYMKVYAKENSDAFIVETPNAKDKPQFSESTKPDSVSGAKKSLSELMQMKNDNPNLAISFE